MHEFGFHEPITANHAARAKEEEENEEEEEEEEGKEKSFFAIEQEWLFYTHIG